MQLGSKENENERFKHYLEKTFKKTASLIANSCKAVCTFYLGTNNASFEKSLLSELLRFLLTGCPLPFKVSLLVNSDAEVHEIAYQYGRNVGIAFQVMSDHLTYCLTLSDFLIYWHFHCLLVPTVHLMNKDHLPSMWNLLRFLSLNTSEQHLNRIQAVI